jgi:uncharacterized protein YdaU (DUF1376 family)
MAAMNALYWWIDRWRKSTAYTDMTLEEQAAYRNLLDEATLRDGALPTDERILAKASGDATRWPALRSVVMRRFAKRDDGWHNETLDRVLAETSRRSTAQRAYRAMTAAPVTSDPEVRRARERARHAVRRAILSGRLTPQPCERCGKAAQAHPEDYDKPLQVRWLCPKHHRGAHDRPRVSHGNGRPNARANAQANARSNVR